MKKAVALRYDTTKENAPKVVGKGKGLMAERIIKIAEENELPIKNFLPYRNPIISYP